MPSYFSWCKSEETSGTFEGGERGTGSQRVAAAEISPCLVHFLPSQQPIILSLADPPALAGGLHTAVMHAKPPAVCPDNPDSAPKTMEQLLCPCPRLYSGRLEDPPP